MHPSHESRAGSAAGEPDAGKRRLLKLATASLLAWSGTGMAGSASAAATRQPGGPPLPENVMTPDDALTRLMAGNERYATGKSTPLEFSEEREALVSGQNPYACILGCSDSRVSPEFCFDEQHGDLFVVRIAGNYLTIDIVATLEYAAAVLHTPLIMVLGHGSCGAIGAAIKASDGNEQFPGHIQAMASALLPSVRMIKDMPGDRYENAIRMNVARTVDKLRRQPPLLSRLVSDEKVRIVGGVYSLKTGRVDLVA
ncbi:carbonic anhydrase [Nitrosovibrio sp. Nv17]|uniref:carbonic anhydrase n=1 Tax=Nitrosovibrio sp. Nv17 TaxID=1855339 RepID=UPI0009091E22|nr:carbonic anhydrase [Nitrosovibrio sp. Nv17]SFW13935.1 carbonic anhydrase [Nitrosovibrio sp. Nv17]